MTVTVKKSKAVGAVTVPPSKSMAHRLIICAGLACGKSIITGVDRSDDVLATISCLNALGVQTVFEGDTLTVFGKGDLKPSHALNCNECGSTLRFFIPICLLLNTYTSLTGSSRLMSRPLDIYKVLCEEKGLYYNAAKNAITLKGPLKSGEYSINANVSSQFISGLLFALPLLDGNSTIKLKGKIESKPYIDMTLSALNSFGVIAYWINEKTLFINGNQKYISKDISVEGDYSFAALFDSFNYIGGNVTVSGLNKHSLQGDRVYKMLYPLLKMGMPIDISDCPDLGPILFVLAALQIGGTFTGTARLKLKESDRGTAMAEELNKCGISVTVEENCVHIQGGTVSVPSVSLYGHGDHRVVMALTVLLSTTGGQIEGAEAVNKSMPSFFELLKKIGVECYFNE